MDWTQICCQYDGSFSGFLSCVFDCYVNREEPVEFRTQIGRASWRERVCQYV